MEFFRRKLCGENLISCALCKKVNSVFLGIQKKKVLFRGFMVKKRYFNFRYLPFPPKEFNFSNLAGHGAFIFLALSYMENDFLNLRLYAMSGITLSILFQYYRERPLWIPIRWNTLFLLINLGMVGAILKKEYDSRHLPLDQKELYIKVFKPSGLSYIDFCFLMSHAEKRTFKAGDVIVREGELHSSVFLVHQGTLEVNRKSMSSSIGKIYPMQFVGEMAFLRWENGCNQISSEDYSFFQPIWDTFSVLSSSVVNVGVQVASSIGLKDWLPWLPSPPFDNTERNRLVTDGTFKLNGLQDKDVHHSDGMDALDVTDSPRGALANSTVICDQECIMYCWKFEDLHDLMKKKPSIDRALERAISTDLNEKILARYSNENKLQYLQVLSAALFENEVCWSDYFFFDAMLSWLLYVIYIHVNIFMLLSLLHSYSRFPLRKKKFWIIFAKSIRYPWQITIDWFEICHGPLSNMIEDSKSLILYPFLLLFFSLNVKVFVMCYDVI